MLSPSFVVLSSAGRRLLVGFKVRSKADCCPTGFAYGGIVSEKGESVKWKMGGSVVLRAKLWKTPRNYAKPYKTMENLKRGFGCFYLLQLLKKKKIKNNY